MPRAPRLLLPRAGPALGSYPERPDAEDSFADRLVGRLADALSPARRFGSTQQ